MSADAAGKRCPDCGVTKPRSDFSVSSGTVAGYCRDCQNRRKRERYAANAAVRERAKAQTKAWRTANPERARERRTAWEQANADRLRQQRSARRAGAGMPAWVVPRPLASPRGGRPTVWTDDQVDQAAALHARGLSALAIATELGLTRSTTRRLLVRAGQVPDASAASLDRRREVLLLLAGHLRGGATLQVAARRSGVTVEVARLLIRQAPELLRDPLPQTLQRQADALRARLVGADVRAAAEAEGVDPWWALLLLVMTGMEPALMQPRRRPEQQDRIEQMAARRAAGATYEQIGAEFGLSRERARRLLLSRAADT